jgi:RHS repeat-associated protein
MFAAALMVQNGSACVPGPLSSQSAPFTTTYRVDGSAAAATRVTGDQTTEEVLDPSGLDRTTSISYTPDDQESSVTQSGSGSTTRTTSYTYDPGGNMTSESVADPGAGGPSAWFPLTQTSGTTVSDSAPGGQTATATDTTWTGSAASFSGTSGQQIATRGPVLDTTGSFTVAAWVDLAGDTSDNQNVVAQGAGTDSGFYLKYDAAIGEWLFTRPLTDTTNPSSPGSHATTAASTGTWTFLTGTYNANTGSMQLYVNGSSSGTTTATDSTPIAAHGSLLIGAGKFNGSTDDFFDGQIADVQMYPRALSASQVSTLYGDGKGGSDVTTGELTTAWTLDERGLPTSMTDPDGNTTYYSYDEAGRLAVTTDPSVPVETYTAAGGDSVVNADPETTTGYDTFGDTTESEDADGNVTTYGYDGDGREVSEALPSYTPLGSSSAITASYTKTYNGLGEVTSATDGAGNETTYAYDQLGDLTSETAPDNGVTSYTYDTNGDQLSATGPTGSETTATYDYLGRQLTSTQVERYTAAGTTDYTTTDAYTSSSTDPGGSWLSSAASPDGSVTKYGYDAAGEETSVTDGAGNTTSYGYDDLGRQTAVTYPDETATDTAYDEAGNVTSVSDLSSGADVLRTESATYDGDGDELSATDFDGDTTSYTYDPTGMLTAEVQPVTASSGITTSFGYDAAGNMTRYTDGDGNDWYYTYNSWGQEESKVEPATSTYTSAADSTDTWAYDADGRPVTETEPGGVTVTDGYNDMSELTSQSGSGASATTADRTFGYDEDGNLTSATTSNTSTTNTSNATSESYTYNDRDELLTSSGSAGSSSYAYNGDGLITSVDDAAGTTGYTYDDDDRLASVDDPATGTTSTYVYNDDSQVKEISYGSDAQDYVYNDLHELTSDTLETSSGATVASIGYGYDPDGQITSMDTTGLAGSADNNYTYDEAGRLTSWDNGTTTTGYGYDNDGNLTADGSKTYTYDARDELTSDGTDTYTYTANGDLASEVTPDATQTSAFDAYGDQVTSGSQSLSYDALGRVLTDDGSSGYTFSYEGSSGTLASDGTSTYTWDPSGTSLVGVGVSGGASSQGVLALTDQHSDVLADFTSGGTSVSGSTAYDPWGDVTATNGSVSGQVGYQSEWTDPVTGKVSMGSRWYTPGTGDFTSADTAQVSAVPDSTAANPFAYAGDDPVGAADPTGHMPIMIRGGSGAGSLASYSHYTPQRSSVAPGTITTPAQAEIDYDRSQASYYAQQASSWSKPKQTSCAWYDPVCDFEKVYHKALDLYHQTMDYAAHYADLVKELSARLAQTGVRDLDAAVSDAAKWGAHAAAATWHEAASVTARVYHTVTKYGSDAVHAAEHVVSTAWHHQLQAATATVDFVKHHAASIASIVTSVAVFAGCEATLGTVTAGAATMVCGGLAGAAGSAVGYVVTAEEHHDFSWSGLGGAALAGGIAGVAGGFLGGAVGGLAGGVAGVLGSGAADAASALAEGAAAEGGADGAADAAGETAAEADGAAGSAGSGAPGPADDPEQAQEARAGADSGQDSSDSCPETGGESFTAGTLVLLADGKTEPVSKLKAGQKVWAMNPRTGKDQAETVTAVLVHHDTDLYDLKIRSGRTTSVIDTTSNHLFWVPGTGGDGGRWVKAGSLKYGTRLRTPGGRDNATVLGGYVPRQRDGWMWDLTVPGNNDHDFYVLAEPGRGNAAAYGSAIIGTPVLVHNCDPFEGTSYTSKVRAQMSKGPGEWHSFPESVKSFVTPGDVSTEVGGDGGVYTHVRIPGGYGDDEGVFHWIIDNEGVINHRQFEPY